VKQLYLLRHAKSAWKTDAASDFQRPLNKRGVRNAREMGQWMNNEGIKPEYILSSPALRAWQTSTLVCEELNIGEKSISFVSDLYHADTDTLLSCLKVVPVNIMRVLLIGHNPALEELLEFLLDEAAPVYDDGKILPTASLAGLSISVDWAELKAGVARLSTQRRPAS